MPAPISIVIPTLNSAADLPECLASLMEGLSHGVIREVIVTDGGSDDETQAIADAAGAQWVTGPASRGGQLHRGVKVARGDWFLVLHSDTRLSAGWSEEVAQHMTQAEAAACFRLGFRAKGFAPGWVAGWANFRTRVFGLPYGDQGILLSRFAYEQAGGYPDQPLMEDVALIRALRHRPVLLTSRALTSAVRYQKAGWLRRGARNLWCLLRYVLGADPEALARAYRR